MTRFDKTYPTQTFMPDQYIRDSHFLVAGRTTILHFKRCVRCILSDSVLWQWFGVWFIPILLLFHWHLQVTNIPSATRARRNNQWKWEFSVSIWGSSTDIICSLLRMRSIEGSRLQPVEMSSAIPLIKNLFYWIVHSLSHALSCVYSSSKNGENPFFMVHKTLVDHVPWSLLFKFVLNRYLGHIECFLNVECTMKHRGPWNKNHKDNSHWNIWLEDKWTQNISKPSESSLRHSTLIGSAHVSKWVYSPQWILLWEMD